MFLCIIYLQYAGPELKLGQACFPMYVCPNFPSHYEHCSPQLCLYLVHSMHPTPVWKSVLLELSNNSPPSASYNVLLVASILPSQLNHFLSPTFLYSAIRSLSLLYLSVDKPSFSNLSSYDKLDSSCTIVVTVLSIFLSFIVYFLMEWPNKCSIL